MTTRLIQTRNAFSADKPTYNNSYAEKFLLELEKFAGTESLDNASRLIQEKKVFDINFFPGKITGKYFEGSSSIKRFEVYVKQFDENTWQELAEVYCHKSAYFASLLNHTLPEIRTEISADPISKNSEEDSDLIDLVPEVAELNKLQLLPRIKEELTVYLEQNLKFIPIEDGLLKYDFIIAALYYFAEQLSKDPTITFLLRGKDFQNFITILKQRRMENLLQIIELTKDIPKREILVDSIQAPKTIEQLCIEDLDKLTFDFKAEELPARLLKGLNPIPLGQLSEKVEFLLEEAYSEVTKRSQAYGLAFIKKG